MAHLSLKSLTKVYPGNVTAVEAADLDVADGEFVVLVGPSGCGKSTMLRMIAGLERITSGTLKIDDKVVNDVEPGHRNIAMVFQNYALYPHMSVRRNMAYGLKNEGKPKAEIEARINEAAQMLRLTEYLDRKPRQLSGGQRQRVAMGRAIVRQPAVFLFDEPLSNLDAKLRTELRAELKALHDRLRGTFVYVTHDQVEAMSLADRIVVMNAGRIEQIGAPIALYSRPETRFVAEFIGSPAMNFVEGVLGEGGAVLVSEGREVLQFDRPIGLAGSGFVVGLRPEHMKPSKGGFARLRFRRVFDEQLGADTLIHGTLDSGPTRVILRVDGALHLPDAERLEVGVAREHLHLFDPKTGLRIDT